jgi:hypothetical protein
MDAIMEDRYVRALFNFVREYRRSLPAGDNLFGVVARFMNNYDNGPDYQDAADMLGDSPPGRAFQEVLQFSTEGRQFIGLLTPQEFEELQNNLVRSVDAFLAFEHFYSGTRSVTKLKQLSKSGLPLPRDEENRIVGFLSPGGRAEPPAAALSRAATSMGKPGVFGRSESPPPPPLVPMTPPPGGPAAAGAGDPPPPPPGGAGGAGPAAAGAGGPAGGKRRRKTRKGKTKKRRYSRRR